MNFGLIFIIWADFIKFGLIFRIKADFPTWELVQINYPIGKIEVGRII